MKQDEICAEPVNLGVAGNAKGICLIYHSPDVGLELGTAIPIIDREIDILSGCDVGVMSGPPQKFEYAHQPALVASSGPRNLGQNR